MTLSVGVIIPTTNRRASLGDCLARLASQTALPARVYLVLEQDAPRPVPAQRSYPQLNVTILQNRGRGPCGGRNTALAECQEDIAAFLDDDSLPVTSWIADCVLGFETSNFAARLGRILWSRTDQRTSFRQHFIPRLRQKIYDARHDLYLSRELRDRMAAVRPVARGCESEGLALHLSGGNSAIRMDVLARIGFYDSRLMTYHDRELAQRLLARGYLIAYNPRMTVWHDHNPSIVQWLRRARFAAHFDPLLRGLHPAAEWSYPGVLEVLNDRRLLDCHLHFTPLERLFLALQRGMVRLARHMRLPPPANPLAWAAKRRDCRDRKQ